MTIKRSSALSGKTIPSPPLFSQHISNHMAASIAALRNQNNVENVMWRHSLLDLYGVPTGIPVLYYIREILIPLLLPPGDWFQKDNSFLMRNVGLGIHFLVARTQLSRAGAIVSCTDFLSCMDKHCRLMLGEGHENRIYPTPSTHFHLDHEKRPAWQMTVQMHAKEDRPCELNEFGNGPWFTDGPSQDIVLASDVSLPLGDDHPYRGDGRYPDSLPSVRISTTHRFLESIILLIVRDHDIRRSLLWGSWINYMLIYVIPTGHL